MRQLRRSQSFANMTRAIAVWFYRHWHDWATSSVCFVCRGAGKWQHEAMQIKNQLLITFQRWRISLGPISKTTTVHSPGFGINRAVMQEQLFELKSDSRLKHLFTPSSLSSFWVALMPEFPQLCDIALKMLLLCASTYLRTFARQSSLMSHIDRPVRFFFVKITRGP